MIKLFRILAVPALALTATAGIAGEPTKSFTHDGIVYVYETATAADGSIVLNGYTADTGARFHLVVKNGQVTGQADRQPVSFPVATSRGAANGAVAGVSNARLASAD